MWVSGVGGSQPCQGAQGVVGVISVGVSAPTGECSRAVPRGVMSVGVLSVSVLGLEAA